MSSDHKPSRKRLMLMGVGGLTLAALLVANGLTPAQCTSAPSPPGPKPPPCRR